MAKCGCNGTGWRLSPDGIIACDCDIAQERQRAQVRSRLAGLEQELGTLAACTFETFDPDRPTHAVEWCGDAFSPYEQRQALLFAWRRAKAYAEQPLGWLYLCGPYGSGKSHLAAATAHRLAERGYTIAYASTPDLLDFIRAGYADGTAHERLDTLKRVQVLILDDIAAENATDWTEERLFVIVNARMLAQRPTIFTSNVRIDALSGRIGSRIAGEAEELLVIASDYRKRGR